MRYRVQLKQLLCMKRILGICGEKSGEHVLRRVNAAMGLQGFVGAVWTPDSSSVPPVLFDGPKQFGVMGFGLNVFTKLPMAYWRMREVKQWIDENDVDCVLTVDNKAFNLRLQDYVKQPKIKSVHVCAPSSMWAFKHRNTSKPGTFGVDVLCCVLPFEPYYWHNTPQQQIRFVGYFGLESLFDYLNIAASATQHGGSYIPASRQFDNSVLPHEIELEKPSGNLPKVSKAMREMEKQRIWSAIGHTASKSKLLLLLPGSREGEVTTSFALQQQVARRVCAADGSIQPVVLAASTINLPPQSEFPVLDERTYKHTAMCAADTALAVSGTVVTELLAFGCPTVCMYNSGGLVTKLYAQHRAKVKYITLINIMAGRELVPEFFFNNDVEAISTQVLRALDCDGEEMLEQVNPLLDHLVCWNGTEPIRPSQMVKLSL